MPRLTYINASGGVTRYEFSSVDVRTNDWAHLAVTHSGTELKCYLNGVLVQTVTGAPDFSSSMTNIPLCVGGDTRTDNTCYFKGYMRDLAVFADVRTDTEIASDYNNGPSLTDADIACYYDLKAVTPEDHMVADSSPKGNDLERLWLSESMLDISKYAYSFAVIGDPQKLLYYDLKDGTDNLTYIFNWLSDPDVIAEKKLAYVFGMGDTTDSRTVDAEYEYAAQEFQKLTDAGIPWQFVQGNHDELPYYDKYFGDSENWKNLDIHYYTGASERPGRGNYYIDNPTNLGSFYVNFTISETDWMFFSLDYGVEDNILDWASEEISKNPTRRVIITTHAYIDGTGEYVNGSQESCPSEIHNTYNDGDDIWEKLIRKHRNILLVLCGHCGADDVIWRQDYTDCGTKVTQMLVNPQNFDPTYDYKTGMVALLHFTEDGRDVGVEYYSTVRGQYFKLKNQFEFDLIDYYGNGIYEIQTIPNADGTTTLRYLYTNGTYEDVIIGGVVEGADGETPYIGENGNWWVGTTDTGVSAQGPQGEQGASGDTPYIGTNGNWWVGETDTDVKAQGEQGETGEQGPQGEAGTNGTNGTDGVTPHIGDNGNWWIGTTDTGVSAQGPQGEQGEAGTNGTDGDTPYIGDNGNWWIGTTDTGIAAQGPQGEQGEQGETGPAGADGADGTDGKDGADGKDGSSGCKKSAAKTLALFASVMTLASVMLFGKKRN